MESVVGQHDDQETREKQLSHIRFTDQQSLSREWEDLHTEMAPALQLTT